MKKKSGIKKKEKPLTMKGITKKHKIVKGKKENPKHLEDFENLIGGLVKEGDNKGQQN